MPRAFVLMPFAGEFDAIYRDLLTPVLEEVGYEVGRADDVLSGQNIMRDVIQGIVSADLIVADLTTSNPNVYYELGIAHALLKPVVLLTQDLSELPFDLRPYRVITYDTHFAHVDTARDALKVLANEAAQGTVPFGNPVSDFSDGVVRTPPDLTTDPEVEIERGILDHQVAMQDGLNRMGEIMGQIGADTAEMTPKVPAFAEEAAQATAINASGGARHVQRLARGLAKDLDDYAVKLSQHSDEYSLALAEFGDSAEAVVGGALAAAEGDAPAGLEDLLAAIHSARENASDARQTYVDTVATLNALPNLERTMTRAQRETAKQIQRLVDNLDQTIAVMDRVTGVGRRASAN